METSRSPRACRLRRSMHSVRIILPHCVTNVINCTKLTCLCTAKTKPSALPRPRTGSAWTLLPLVASVVLTLSETRRWFAGTVSHSFSVEKGVSHALQINVDVVVAMHCADVHVNVQDAAGDRILAGELLKKDPTVWSQWGRQKGQDEPHQLGQTYGDDYGLGEEEDVHDYL